MDEFPALPIITIDKPKTIRLTDCDQSIDRSICLQISPSTPHARIPETLIAQGLRHPGGIVPFLYMDGDLIM
jgi:hypothetical protein